MTYPRPVAALATAVLLTSASGHAQPTGAEPDAAPAEEPADAKSGAAESGDAEPGDGTPGAGDAVAYETAKQLYAEARDARAAEDWNRCKVKATAAWGVFKSRAPLAALLGECQLRLGEHVEAARHLALSLSFDDLNPKLREHTATLLDEAKQHVAILEVTVDGGAADAPGVTLLIDGKTAESFPLYLAPGSHTIEARHSERGEASQTLTLEGGTEGKVNLTLKAGGGGNGDPGNGDSAEGGLPLWPGFVLGGVGLVGVGVGVGLMVAAGGKRSDAQSEADSIVGAGESCLNPSAAFQARCADLADQTSSIDSLETGALVGFVAGGALLLGGAGYLIYAAMGDEPTAETAARIRFGASISDGATLTINGTF